MSWVKLDDGFPDHPKALGLSDAAFRAYIEGLCYSARFLTDGLLLLPIARRFANAKALSQLADASLWEAVSTGWQIHDYLAYNPSREKVLAEREAARRTC